MSHLACADEPGHPMNAYQLDLFRQMTDGTGVPRSLAATGGILLGRDYHFDVTRPGIGLYGGLPFADAAPVVAARPAGGAAPRAGRGRGRRLRQHLAGERGRRGSPPSRAAMPTGCTGRCGGGAASVARRHALPRGRPRLDGPDHRRRHRPGAEPPSLAILGPHQGVDALAELCGTIGYEMLTGLGRRYDRRYLPRRDADAPGPPLRRRRPRDLGLLAETGRLALFTGGTLSRLVRPPFYPREFGIALLQIGYFSLPVVGLTAFFTGGALALQIFAGGARFQAEAVVPQIVAIGMVRELGPVLVGLMIAARVTSSIAAEIATMRVTEQIDALVTLSTDPLRFLALPRVLAGTLVTPILVAVGDIIGILGGFVVGTSRLGFQPHVYIANTIDFLEPLDIVSSLVKGAAFGFLAALMGTWYGMTSGRGAEGVGRATKSAVVAAAVLILAANFLLTQTFFPA